LTIGSYQLELTSGSSQSSQRWDLYDEGGYIKRKSWAQPNKNTEETKKKQEFYNLLTSFHQASKRSTPGNQSGSRSEIVLAEFLSLIGYDENNLFDGVSIDAEELHPVEDLQSDYLMTLCSPSR